MCCKSDSECRLVVLLFQVPGIHRFSILRAAQKGQSVDVLAHLPSQHDVSALVDWREMGAERI